METNQEILELLRKIEKSNRQKSVTNALICVFMLVAAVSCIAVCVMLSGLMPQVNSILTQMETALVQMETTLASLEQTSGDLAALELETMVTNVDAMAVMAQESLSRTMEKLDMIDFETLNQAIEDLSKVIKPLAEFAGLFD